MPREKLAELLAQNVGHHDLEAPVPSLQDLEELGERLGVELPTDYRDFVLEGGLRDLRFSNHVLEPQEIVENLLQVGSKGLVPFASNGSGDLYCVARNRLPSGPMVLWDHETGSVADSYSSLLAALRDWRF